MRLILALILTLLALAPSASAAVTEAALPSAMKSPLAIEVAPDGQVYFTLDGSWALGHYDPTTGRADSRPLGASRAGEGDALYGIALSSDAVYTASNAKLHRAGLPLSQPDATDLPAATKLSGGVFVDDAGAVWAALTTSDKLARFGDSLKTFTITPNSGPLLFARAGKDAALVTLTYANALGRLDTQAGTMTTIATGIQAPTGVAWDGQSAWVGEHGGDSIVRVTGDKVARFPVAASPYYPISGPNGIVVAHDGAIWSAIHFGDRLSRLDPTNLTIVEYEVPSSPGTNVQHLAVAPDGKVWFAEWSANKIGYAEYSGEKPNFALPAGAQAISPKGTFRFTLDSDGLQARSGVELISARVDGRQLVVEDKGAPAGTYYVLVSQQTGKTFVGQYVVFDIAKSTPAPALLAALGLVIAALAWRRR